jgi:hypothetical protein
LYLLFRVPAEKVKGGYAGKKASGPSKH